MPPAIWLTYGEETYSLRAWSTRRGIGCSTLVQRKHLGWSDGEVLGFEPRHRPRPLRRVTAPPAAPERQSWCPHDTHGIPLRSLRIAHAIATAFGCTRQLAVEYRPCAQCGREEKG